MNVSNFEIDAQLLEQFSSLGTDDKEDLIKAFQFVVGGNVNSECCRFFLELANWNLQKGIGAYFDYSFDSSPANTSIIRSRSETSIPSMFHNTNLKPSAYNARVYLSPTSDVKETSKIIWCVQNTGSSTWLKESYICSEVDPSNAPFISTSGDSAVWIPLQIDSHIPLPELSVGSYTHIVVHVLPPSSDVCIQSSINNSPIIGALKLCLPNGTSFGEILYCTCIPDAASQSILYRVGLPDMSKFTSLPKSDSQEMNQPMEDL